MRDTKKEIKSGNARDIFNIPFKADCWHNRNRVVSAHTKMLKNRFCERFKNKSHHYPSFDLLCPNFFIILMVKKV